MPDNTFIIADYAQIEARVLSWLAGQDDLTEAFRRGEDIYSKFATRLFGVPIRKPVGDDPEPVAKYLKIKRGFGKDAILGCGYGMGAGTFYDRCLSNDSLRPLFDSGQYDLLFVDKLIKTYRNTYTKIPQLWRNIEKAFRWVIKYPACTICYDDGRLTNVSGNRLGSFGTLTFYNDNGTVCIRLPSSRVLFYPRALIKSNGRDLVYQWSGNVWGGFLVENIVQAISRDILGEALLRVHKIYPVVLHSHDELVCIVPKKEARIASDVVLGEMVQVPDWAGGVSTKALPIAVEIETSEVYKK